MYSTLRTGLDSSNTPTTDNRLHRVLPTRGELKSLGSELEVHNVMYLRTGLESSNTPTIDDRLYRVLPMRQWAGRKARKHKGRPSSRSKSLTKPFKRHTVVIKDKVDEKLTEPGQVSHRWKEYCEEQENVWRSIERTETNERNQAHHAKSSSERAPGPVDKGTKSRQRSSWTAQIWWTGDVEQATWDIYQGLQRNGRSQCSYQFQRNATTTSPLH